MANDMNESKRQLSPDTYLEALIVWQMPSCKEIFEAGSPPLIHGKITTSLADYGITRPGNGLLVAGPS